MNDLKNKRTKTLINKLRMSGEEFLKNDVHTQEVDVPAILAILKSRKVI